MTTFFRLRSLFMAPALIALSLALAAAPARAALDEDAYRTLNRTLIVDYVLPAYAQLAESAAAFQGAIGSVCETPNQENLADIQRLFGELADDWQRVAPFRFGPAQFLMRSQRFAFWPDPKDAVGAAVDDRIGALDFTTLIEEEIRDGSVAGQGLPALEQLLFGEEAEAAFLAGDDAAQFRCAYAAAISDNLAWMAADLVHEWGDETAGFASELLAAGSDPDGHYLSQREVTFELFKSFYGSVEIVAGHKLTRPLDESVETAKPRLAEAWRSNRSLANISVNLEGAMAMYELPGGIGDTLAASGNDPELDPLLRRAFPQTIATLASIEMPLQDAIVDPEERKKVEKLALETRALKALFEQRLAPALDIPVGFNAMDGD
jgi:predicted lipoprotein